MKLLPLCALIFTAPCASRATPIPFREFGSGRPVDVNGIHVHGVLLGFSPARAYFNQAIATGQNAMLSTDPMLEGTPTTFDPPASLLPVDMIEQIGLSTDAADTQPNRFSSETEPPYSGDPIDPVITVYAGVGGGGMSILPFGLDQLPFAVREPASFFTLVSGLLALGWIRHPRSRRRIHRGMTAVH